MQILAVAPVVLVVLTTAADGRLLAPPNGSIAVADAPALNKTIDQAEQIEEKAEAQVKKVKAREEQIMTGIAKTMAKADAVNAVTVKAMEKIKQSAKEALAPALPVDAKAAAAGRALLKVAAKNSNGVKVEEDKEGTAIIAERLLEAYAANLTDAKMRQLFEKTKDSIKAVRTKRWKTNISATSAAMEKDIAREADKVLPVEISKLKKWKDAKKKVASFTQTVSHPVPVVSGDVNAICDQFEQGFAAAKKQGLVNHEESLLGLLIIHQRRHDWSVQQQLDATKKAVDESPVIAHLYRSHKDGDPLALQLAQLMDAGRDERAGRTTTAVARVFLQVAKALPLVRRAK